MLPLSLKMGSILDVPQSSDVVTLYADSLTKACACSGHPHSLHVPRQFLLLAGGALNAVRRQMAFCVSRV